MSATIHCRGSDVKIKGSRREYLSLSLTLSRLTDRILFLSEMENRTLGFIYVILPRESVLLPFSKKNLT